jgi:hypothetical protein
VYLKSAIARLLVYGLLTVSGGQTLSQKLSRRRGILSRGHPGVPHHTLNTILSCSFILVFRQVAQREPQKFGNYVQTFRGGNHCVIL